MSKFIPIACLAVLGTAGYASAASSPQAASAQTDPQDHKVQLQLRVADSARSYTTLGIRYEMKM